MRALSILGIGFPMGIRIISSVVILSKDFTFLYIVN